MIIIITFAGAENCSVDAEVLQEARLQMHLHPHPECQHARAPRAFPHPEGLGPPQRLVL